MDVYYLWWSDEEFVHICSKRFKDRTASKIDIKVYSNQPVVKLYVNGELFEEKAADKIFIFKNVPLTQHTGIRAVTRNSDDNAVFEKKAVPNEAYKLKSKKNKSSNWV